MRKFFIPLLGLGLIYFSSCQKDMYRIIQVNTNTATAISDSIATATGRVIDVGENGVKQYGHCWDTIQKPTISSNKNNCLSALIKYFTIELLIFQGFMKVYQIIIQNVHESLLVSTLFKTFT
ncbi:MAG: hypothetical protein HY958_13090, partial [Bacteroidia bacterium]|nr:hypothetical protein [Bacteroidia bacterium]